MQPTVEISRFDLVEGKEPNRFDRAVGNMWESCCVAASRRVPVGRNARRRWNSFASNCRTRSSCAG